MVFRVEPAHATSFVYADGLIKNDTVEKLQAFLESERPEGQIKIIFNSVGGNLSGGIQLGQFIRKYNYATGVEDGVCLSSCALAFLGGIERTVYNDNSLGFHQFFSEDNNLGSISEIQKISSYIASYLRNMGVKSDLFEQMALTKPEEMFFPNKEQLAYMNIVTDNLYDNFQLLNDRGQLVAVKYSPQNRGGRALFPDEIKVYCVYGESIFEFYRSTKPLDESIALELYERKNYEMFILQDGNYKQIQLPKGSDVTFFANQPIIARLKYRDSQLSKILVKYGGRINLGGATVFGILVFEEFPAEDIALKAVLENCQ